MQHEIPQNLEIPDKIFGPLTFFQFIYLGGGVGLSSLIIKYIPGIIALFLVPIVVALAGTLAFYKLNSRPFSATLEAGIKYLFHGKLYRWQHRKQRPELQSEKIKREEAKLAKQSKLEENILTSSKLSDISTGLDILDTTDNNKQSKP